MTQAQATYITKHAAHPHADVTVTELAARAVELTISEGSHQTTVTLDAAGNVTSGPTRELAA